MFRVHFCRFLNLFVFVYLISSCASKAVQTENFFSTQAVSIKPQSKLVAGVPFVQQDSHQCGPATLSMAMSWAGHPVSVTDIEREVYNPKMQGSLQLDLISSSRRNGLVAIPISGMEALLKEVASGHPVIVFENLAFAWLPQWHYAIVIGYDLHNRKVILHSGPEANKVWAMDRFERSWMLGDYWGLLILPPSELSATGSELDHLKAAAGLELADQLSAAERSYQAILSKWPESLPAQIGLGNVAFVEKDFQKSVNILSLATEKYPNSAMAWHNLAIAQGSAQLKKEASQSAKRAVQLAGSAKAAYLKNLMPWLKDIP